MFTYPPSLTFRFSLCVKGRNGGVQQSRPNMKHGFAAQGSSHWTRRGRDIQTQTPITTENLSFGISLSLSLSGIHLQCYKEVINCSNTSWNNPQLQASLYMWPRKLRCREANFSGDVTWWWTGRLGLRHWIVASRGCDSIASFSCHSKATSPSVYWCRVFYWPSHD